MTPMQLDALLDETAEKHVLEKIEKLIIGGAFLSSKLEKKLESQKTQIWQTYGMTETITHIALRKINGQSISDFYKPLSGVEVGKNENNCLVISTKHLGIKNLITNDLVEFDSDGKFKVLGRIDNVVNSGGIKLHPELIEKKLEDLIEKPFFFTGIADEKLGERLTLFIESEEIVDDQLAQLWKGINKKLSGFEIPKEIIFKKELSRTLSGKIIRKNPD
jgi:O-succinylbenzoic acid--CoA ligase